MGGGGRYFLYSGGLFMSTWEDDVFGAAESEGRAPSLPDEFFSRYPNLANFLTGDFDEQGKVKRPPGSLSLWIDEGRLKACFKIKSLAKVGFAVLPEPQYGFQKLEDALNKGLVEWRTEGKRSRS